MDQKGGFEGSQWWHCRGGDGGGIEAVMVTIVVPLGC